MSKKRIIAVILVKDGWAVQSLGFSRYLPVGRPEIAARHFSTWGADEIILLDIEASRQSRLIDLGVVERVASQTFVPLTVGGGIRSLACIRDLVQAGADKVCVNRAAFVAPEFVREAAASFGNQCIIGAMDVRRTAGGGHEVLVDGGTVATGCEAADYARRLAALDVGEILVQSIDNDGLRQGYDGVAADTVGMSVACPVILLGGAGHPRHLADALARPHISAVAAANFFNYCEHAIAVAKASLGREGHDVRLDSRADYRHHVVASGDGRLRKRAEGELADEVFEFLPEEII